MPPTRSLLASRDTEAVSTDGGWGMLAPGWRTKALAQGSLAMALTAVCSTWELTPDLRMLLRASAWHGPNFVSHGLGDCLGSHRLRLGRAAV